MPKRRIVARHISRAPRRAAPFRQRSQPVRPLVDVAQNSPAACPAPIPSRSPRSKRRKPVPPPQPAAGVPAPALRLNLRPISAPWPWLPIPRQPHVSRCSRNIQPYGQTRETLSTDHNYAGDTFQGTLESPVILDGFIIADKGSKVLGKSSAQKGGRVDEGSRSKPHSD